MYSWDMFNWLQAANMFKAAGWIHTDRTTKVRKCIQRCVCILINFISMYSLDMFNWLQATNMFKAAGWVHTDRTTKVRKCLAFV